MTKENPLEEFAFENPVEAVGYAQLRHVIMLDRELSDGAYRTFATYIKYAQQKPACWPSIGTIATDRGKSECTISRHNQELEELGYIERQRRTGLTTLTIIKDLNQVPRLKGLALKELEGREGKDCKNARCNVAKMQGETLQKCDGKEEQSEEKSPEKQESPPATVEENDPLPSTFQGWRSLLQEPGANQPAVIRLMHETLYPEHPPPDYGYCGKAARRVGGYEVLALRLWELAPRPPVGDVFAYIQGIKKGNGRKESFSEQRRRFLEHQQDEGVVLDAPAWAVGEAL